VNDGYKDASTITSNDTANARMMGTYWYANPQQTTPVSTNMMFTVTNLPNDTYDVYVYVLQSVSQGTGGAVVVYDSTYADYVEYSEFFSSASNFVTAVNTTGTGLLPYANYVKLTISTGGSNSISFDESGTAAGVGGSGVCGVQIVPKAPVAVSIIQQPASQRVDTNLPAAFTVVANGYPLNYQWYGISTAGVTNALANATNATYTTPPVVDGNTGTGFFVVVSNSINNVQSATAYLTAGHMVTVSGVVIDNEYYNLAGGTGGSAILGDLYPNSAWLAANPQTLTEYLNTFESSNDLPIQPPPANPAQSIYGWFTPAVSGDYVFFIASDDGGALWLSTDNTPANAYLIAQNQAGMAARDWTCSNTGSGEYTGGYHTSGEFRSDLFISGGGANAINQYTTGWTAIPTFQGDNGIALVAGTPYYMELDNYYTGGTQCAAVNYKLVGNSDPVSGSVSLFADTNISASVPDITLPVPTPVISVAVPGSNVIINGNNGLVNAHYNVQTKTNLTVPWTTSVSGYFDASGHFSITNAIQSPVKFYRLQQVVP
jgi:hypothetical protein